MNKGKALAQIGIAVLLACVAGFLALRWMDSAKPETKVVEVQKPTVRVAVAARIISPGTKLGPDMVRVVDFLETSVPDGVFATAEEVVGRIVLSPLSQGEPITRLKLASTEIGIGGVSALVNPGMRAMAVKGNRVMGIAGFVNPGNRVDVLVTLDHDGRGGARDRPVSKLVLENVLVLATGEKLEADEEGKVAPVDVYTLEVSPEQAERLALASLKGELNFALRGSLDNDPVLTPGMDLPRVLQAHKPRPKPTGGQPTRRVELITGASRTVVSF